MTATDPRRPRPVRPATTHAGAAPAPYAQEAGCAGGTAPVDTLLRGLQHQLEGGPPALLADGAGRLLHANTALSELLARLQAGAPDLLEGWIAGALAGADGPAEAWTALPDLLHAPTPGGDPAEPELRVLRAVYRGAEGAPELVSLRLLPAAPAPAEAAAAEAGAAEAGAAGTVPTGRSLQEQLDTLRARFEDIVRLVTDWVWETDRDLRLTYVSQRVSETLGRHPRMLLGTRLTDLGAAPYLEGLADEEWRRPFRDVEVEIRDAEGRPHLFRLSAVPCFTVEGAFAGYRGTAHDVTRERTRERAILQAKEAAESANRAKSEFLAAISHELRTPLNAVIGFSEVMMTEAFGPMGQDVYAEYARDIHESAAHLLELINDILDVSKIEAGKLKLDEEETDLVALIRATARLVQARAGENGIALAVEVEPDLPEVTLDARTFKQVMLNLLSNAVKFTESGGRVALSAGIAPDGCFVLQVVDTGIGMTPEEIEVALTAFGQVDSSLSRKFQGTGLGLPLTKGLVELHGGRLEIDSRKPGGTSVTVRLPAWRVCRDEAELQPSGAQA